MVKDMIIYRSGDVSADRSVGCQEQWPRPVGGTLPPLPLLAAAQSDIQRDESIQLGATQLYQCLFRDEQIPFGIEHFKVLCDALAVASAGKIGDRSLCRSGTNLRGDLFSKPAAPGKGVRTFPESSLNGAFVFRAGNILTCLSQHPIALPPTKRTSPMQ